MIGFAYRKTENDFQGKGGPYVRNGQALSVLYAPGFIN
jgi:hypothetical protein